MTSAVELICSAIEAGRSPTQAEMVVALGVESAEQRCQVNYELAKAYFRHTEDHAQAAVFIERAFMLSGTSEACLALFVDIQRSLGDLERIRAAYRQMGDRYAALGNIPHTLRCYGMSRDTFALAGEGNRYEYDMDIIAGVTRLANRLAPLGAAPRRNFRHGKIRVAYLAFHVKHPESVIIKLLGQFARYHDPSKFEVCFFVAESAAENDAVSLKNIDVLTQAGARVVQTEATSPVLRWLDTARRIHSYRPDILVTTAVLADYGHYFVSLLARAPVNIGMGYGPPELYMPPNLDWVIAGTRQPLLDCPCDGSVIRIESELPDRNTLSPASRNELGIPKDALIVASAGRPEKFMSRKFWEALVSFLELRPESCFVVIGLDRDPPFLADVIPEGIRHRVIRLGWLKDYLSVLGLADIVVDTYPSGGGIVIIDCMALSIPVVSFRGNYFGRFNQMEWNLGEDLVGIPDLIVDREDFDGLVRRLAWLAENKALREALGADCMKMARETMGSPARYVSRHEVIYEEVLRRKADAYAEKPAAVRAALRVGAVLSRWWFTWRCRMVKT